MRFSGDGDPGQRENDSDHNGDACGDCGPRRAMLFAGSRLFLHYCIQEDCEGKPSIARKAKPGAGLQTCAEKASRRKLAPQGKNRRNIHQGTEEVAVRQDQERTRADNPALRNQKKPRNEISEERERKYDRWPGAVILKQHSPKWDNGYPDGQQHKADHKRYSTLRLSSRQIRQHDATLVIRLVQGSLPKPFLLYIIAPAIAMLAF
jgi:hypothetical protein